MRKLFPLIQFFVLFTFITLPIDQWTKDYCRRHFLIREDVSDSAIYQGTRQEIFAVQSSGIWLTGQVTYVRNHGASWGVFSNVSPGLGVPWLLILGLMMAASFLWVAFWLFQGGHQKTALSISALIAGGLGNFVDRVRLGYVVDFLTIRCGWGARTWVIPSFNVADIIIVLSLITVIHTLFFNNPHNQAKSVT